MRITTWNVARRRGSAACYYLREEICPDVALLQEVLPTCVARLSGDLFSRPGNVIFRTIGATRPWGSAIYACGLKVKEIKLESHHGWVVAGQVSLPDGSDIIAVSVHAQIINNSVFPNLRKIFDNLSLALKGRQFVVGGNLNSCRLIDKVYGTTEDGEFFDWVESNGFFNTHKKFHEEEQQTFWGGKDCNPYQDDHLFVSGGLIDKVKSCHVVNNEHTRKLSDHSPLVIDLALSTVTD